MDITEFIFGGSAAWLADLSRYIVPLIAVLIVVLGVVLSNVSNRIFRRSEDL